MKSQTSFAVIGGDMRQAYLANILYGEGYEVITCGITSCPGLKPEIRQANTREAVQKADVIILPLPVSRDDVTINAPFSMEPLYLNDIFSTAAKGQVITGGMLSGKLISAALDIGVDIVDYLEREELAVLNAIPTAEGALEIAIRESRHTIYGSDILISGYGRIGKILTRMLIQMGANIFVSLRKKSDKAWALSERAQPIFTHQIKDHAQQFDIIFNTVPHMIFDNELLKHFKSSALFIDLASLPGGIDLEAARSLGMKAILAQSLPGKCAPYTAAEFIKETIFNIMEEQSNSAHKS